LDTGIRENRQQPAEIGRSPEQSPHPLDDGILVERVWRNRGRDRQQARHWRRIGWAGVRHD
jgi:hypothetical protein